MRQQWRIGVSELTIIGSCNGLSSGHQSLLWAKWCQMTQEMLVNNGSDKDLSPVLHQTITCTNTDLLYSGPPATNFSEISIKILQFSFKKMNLKMSSGKWRPFCPGLLAVWYKTKFGSQNFGYQIWWLFCNTCNVFKNMFNMSLIIMW